MCSRDSSPEPQNLPGHTEAKPVAQVVGPQLTVLTATSPTEKEDNYDIDDVVEKMLARRDRLIPGTVYKPHSEKVYLIESRSLGQPVSQPRVFFTYPKYCFKDDEAPTTGNLEIVAKKIVTSESMKQGETFMQIAEWHKGEHLKPFQTIKLAQQDYFREHNMTLGFKVTETTHIYNSYVNTFKVNGVRIVSPLSTKWNVMWTGIVKNEYLKEATKF